MDEIKKLEIKLEVDSYYSLNEILCMRMQPLNNHKLDYLVYEKDDHIYFFEKVDNNLLRLFCATSKKSFYLS